MSNWFSRVFAASPFEPLIAHQRIVVKCVSHVPDAVQAALDGDHDRLRACVKQISSLEYEADLAKNRVRDHLPNTIFMPVSRVDLLDVLSAQDSIADAAEDVGVLLTMRPMTCPPEPIVEKLKHHVEAVIKVVHVASEVVEELEKLARTSFSGPDAERVFNLIDDVANEEHLADKIQDQLAKEFFKHEEHFKPAEIFLWLRIFENIAAIANYAEKMTNRVRLFLAN